MKKAMILSIVTILCLLTTAITVNAISIQWFVGYQFDQYNKSVVKEYTRTGNFNNGIELLKKYSAETVSVSLSAEKKGLIFWSAIGTPRSINALGAEGAVYNNRQERNYYTASGTNQIRVKWQQTTSGHLAVFLLYNTTSMSN